MYMDGAPVLLYCPKPKGSLIWNMVPNKSKRLVSIADFKKHIEDLKPTTWSC